MDTENYCSYIMYCICIFCFVELAVVSLLAYSVAYFAPFLPPSLLVFLFLASDDTVVVSVAESLNKLSSSSAHSLVRLVNLSSYPLPFRISPNGLFLILLVIASAAARFFVRLFRSVVAEEFVGDLAFFGVDFTTPLTRTSMCCLKKSSVGMNPLPVGSPRTTVVIIALKMFPMGTKLINCGSLVSVLAFVRTVPLLCKASSTVLPPIFTVFGFLLANLSLSSSECGLPSVASS